MQDQDQPENGIFIEITNNGKARERPDGRVEMKESCLGVNPADSESYFDRCAVHQMVSDLQKLHPKWPNEDYVNTFKALKSTGEFCLSNHGPSKNGYRKLYPARRGDQGGGKIMLSIEQICEERKKQGLSQWRLAVRVNRSGPWLGLGCRI